MADVVLDASALIAYLREEPGAERVASALPKALICTVNLTEVLQRFSDLGASEGDLHDVFGPAPWRSVGFDEALAWRAGLLRSATRSRGLSLGDRACLALAQRERLPVLTADRAWAALDIGVEVVLIR